MPIRTLPLPQPARREEAVERAVTHFGIGTYWLRQGELRLDARYYAQDAFQARRVIEESRWPVKTLGTLTSNMFNLPRFKRVYTSEPAQGYPYLSANDVLMFRPKPDRYLARQNLPEAGERHFVEPGWILMTCSGTVGRLVITGIRLQGIFLTHDLIRIIPQNLESVGYLYAFLASSLGQPLITKDRYGSAIQHLEPHHLASLPVPLLPEEEQKAIHEQVMEAYRLRDEANALLDEAEQLLHQELGLPIFAVIESWAASEHILRIIPDDARCHGGYITAFLMTAYGHHQLISKIYGGVVDELTEGDTAAVLIPVPPLGVQQRIGELVVAAFEKKGTGQRGGGSGHRPP